MTQQPRRVALMLDLQWPYKRHAGIFAGTQQYAEEHGWIPIIDEFVHNTLPARRGAAVRYDGIIARANRQLVARAARLGVPVVNVWQSSPARRSVPGVYPDSTAVGGLLAEHLLARGFRNFASLSAHNNVDHELEVKEFVRVVNEAGFLCLSQRIPQNPWKDLAHWQKTERLITQWMDGWQHPIGVHVGGEGEGRMVTQECHRRGWRVPADAAIIAGKNQELLCEHPRPSLTSIEIGYERIGYEAAHLLDGMMEGEPAPRSRSVFPHEGWSSANRPTFSPSRTIWWLPLFDLSQATVTAVSARTTWHERWAPRRGRCKTIFGRSCIAPLPPRSAVCALSGPNGN